MDLREYLRLLRRRWRLVTVSVLAALSLALLATVTATSQYTAKVTLFVSAQDRSSNDISSAYTGGLFTQQRVKSYVSVIQSVRTAELVKQDLNLPERADKIADRITAKAPVDTVLINVAVTDFDAARAQRIANSLGSVFPTEVEEIERPTSGGPSPVRVTMVQSADLPVHPTSPRPKINLLLGLLVGLGVGVGAAVLRDTLDTSVKNSEQARDILGAPVLGSINFDSDATKQPLVVISAPASTRAEAFRQLRTNLQFVDIEHPLRSVAFTSSIPGEGKSTTTCNLAITLTQAGLSVILVEGDLRRPRIAHYMGLEGAVGLTSVLLGRTSLEDALQPWGEGQLQVLASGPLPPNPSELLGSQGMQDLLRELEDRVDIVLIDAPPLLPVTDAAVLGTLTSGLVMLIRSNTTRREQLAQAVNTVHAVGGIILGAVMNMVPARDRESYSYGYTYAPMNATGKGRKPSGLQAPLLEGRRPSEDVLPHLRDSGLPGPARVTPPPPPARVTPPPAAAEPSPPPPEQQIRQEPPPPMHPALAEVLAQLPAPGTREAPRDPF
ncbi:MAG: Protein-tyrosine kinase [Frankiales bacterium]|nr:Protein-tyrosine kinase [Frankiales bacterium]